MVKHAGTLLEQRLHQFPEPGLLAPKMITVTVRNYPTGIYLNRGSWCPPLTGLRIQHTSVSSQESISSKTSFMLTAVRNADIVMPSILIL